MSTGGGNVAVDGDNEADEDEADADADAAGGGGSIGGFGESDNGDEAEERFSNFFLPED